MSSPYQAPHRSRGLGLTLALLSATAFGGSGALAKPLIEAGVTPLQVTWLRVAGAALALLPLLVRYWPQARRRPGLMIGYGLIAIAGCQAFYFAALSRIPIGVAILMEFTGPVIVLLWIKFGARRPVSARAAAGVVLAVTGLAMVVEVWSGMRFDPVGLLFGFGAACCQAFYFVLADSGSGSTGPASADPEPADPRAMISYGLLAATVGLTVVSRPWQIDWTLLGEAVRFGSPAAPFGSGSAPAALLVALLALVTTVLAYLTGVWAVRRLSAQVAAAVACLEVVVAAGIAWVALGEALSALQVAGGFVVLAGAFVAQTATSETAVVMPEQAPSRTPETAAR